MDWYKEGYEEPEINYETIHGFLKRETDNAILLMVDLHDHWLPKSQISYDGEVNTFVYVEVPDWLLEDKGLV